MNKRKPENQTIYYQEHPPKCIRAFTVEAAQLGNIEFDGHSSSGIYPDGLVENPNTVFAVRCQCGNSLHTIIAESDHQEIWRHENLVVAEKYFLECGSCHVRHQFFDRFSHGYDAEGSPIEGYDLQEFLELDPSLRLKEKVTCECFRCGSITFESLHTLSIHLICLMSLYLKEKSKSSFHGLQELESAAPVQPSMCLLIMSVREQNCHPTKRAPDLRQSTPEPWWWESPRFQVACVA